MSGSLGSGGAVDARLVERKNLGATSRVLYQRRVLVIVIGDVNNVLQRVKWLGR